MRLTQGNQFEVIAAVHDTFDSGSYENKKHLKAVSGNSARRASQSQQHHRYPALLADCGWRRLTAPDQAWAADLTYVRLGAGFCYLAVILDAFSRRVLGWNLSPNLDARLSLTALEQALCTRKPRPGWIHHSDRGVQ